MIVGLDSDSLISCSNRAAYPCCNAIGILIRNARGGSCRIPCAENGIVHILNRAGELLQVFAFRLTLRSLAI
jgi:hypothetical protein